MSKDALEAVAQAAVSIAAERDRLTKALDGLRTTVQMLDPSAQLFDDGSIRFEAGPPVIEPEPPPEAPKPAPKPAPEPKPTPPPAARTTATEGLARSPVPRSEMKTQQREREGRLDIIAQYMMDQVGRIGNPIDCAADLEFSKERVSSDFRVLEERGVFRRTGRFVHSRSALRLPPIKRGRQTIEYQYVRITNGPPVETPPKPPARRRVTDEEVRDAGVKLDEFNMHEMMQELGANETNRGQIVRALEGFVNRGSFRRTLKGWKYSKPVDPGAAAAHDAGIARGSGTRNDISPHRNSAPVPGTGQPKQSGNKDVNEMLAAARRQWPGSVEQSGDSHWKIKLPAGSDLPFVRIANSPGSAKSLNGDKAKLRKAGLQGI